MLRQPLRRTFTTFARQRLQRTPARRQQEYPDGTPLTYQKVRFQRPPFFTWRRAASAVVYTLPFYLFFKYGPIGVSLRLDDEVETLSSDEVGVTREEEEEEEEEFEGDEDATFIPFSWPKEEERTFYRGSDPEWQEFLKLAKDPKRHRDVHSRLALKIRSEVAGHPQAPQIMGKVDHSKGRFWLDTQFPAGPPRAITVNGIEIGAEYIAWVTKEIDQEEFASIKRAIYPTAAFWSFIETTKYLAKVQYHRTREYLGLPPAWQVKRIGPKSKDGDTPMAPGSPQAGPMNSSTGSTAQGLAEELAAAKAAATSTQAQPSNGVPPPSSSPAKGTPKDLLPMSASGNSIAFMVFMNAMRKNIGPQKLEAPRGCAVMSGLVEVLGDKGKAVVDVTAAYDPKKDEFVVSGWFPRRIQPRRQHPRGGP